MDTLYAAVKTRLASGIRRGRRRVLRTPNPGPRFGNFLYYWLHAHISQEQGYDYRVEVHDHLSDWLRELPLVNSQLSIPANEIGVFDRREWPPSSQYQAYNRDFDYRDLERFIQQILLPSPLLSDTTPVPGACLVINVRRGDYYSVPEFKMKYGFDVEQFVVEALTRAHEREAVHQVLFVSDDPEWCRMNLQPLMLGRGIEARYVVERNPLLDFQMLCGARRLVLANSTFSYWGGYISSVRFGRRAHVVAPSFFSTMEPSGARRHLLPSFDVLEVAH